MRQYSVMATLTMRDGEDPTITVDFSFPCDSYALKDYAASILDRGSQLLRGAPHIICTCMTCVARREEEAARILKETIERAGK